MILFVLIGLGCVCAADNETMDDAALESDTVTEDILMDEPATANFTTLKNDIANEENELKLERNYTFNHDEDYDYVGSGGVEIRKDNFVIDGQGRTINGAGETRIFMVHAKNVTIKNLNFINGRISGSGGAIYWPGDNGMIENCNFTNNTAQSNSAGAIESRSTITLVNCNFNNNSARYSAVGSFSYANIINCSFTNNIAQTRAGAIDCAHSNITNCTFINNRQEKEEYGGALVCYLEVMVSNCNFINNTGLVGGAIYLRQYGIIADCNFTNNNASESGGALYFENSGAVTNSNFTNNKATADNGGAIWISSGRIENCNFDNNFATLGSAVYLMETGTVSYSNFTNNEAYENSAVYFDNSGNVANCNFNDNTALGNDKNGGAVYFNTAGGNVVNSNFTNNKVASGNGGAVYFKMQGNVGNCKFDNNSADYGGAVYFLDKGEVTDCIFTDNYARGNGGAVLFGSEGNATGCNFTHNNVSASIQSTGKGAAVHFSESGAVTSCNFANNLGIDNGAVTFIGLGRVENCNFTNNEATLGVGGALVFTQSGIVENSNFANNTAMMYGGAISFELYSRATIENCSFTGNNASGGSAIIIYSFANTHTISNSLFLDNRADADSLQLVKNGNNIEITFRGHNNILNAIRSNGDVTFTNVTYLGANGIANTGSSPTVPSLSNKEAGQNVTVVAVVNGITVLNATRLTDENGTIVLEGFASNSTITARHDGDSYYTQAEATKTFTLTTLSVSEWIVTATVTPNSPSGKVTITVQNESGTVKNAEIDLNGGVAQLDLIGLAVGEYNITATYAGNTGYDSSAANMTYMLLGSKSTYSVLSGEIGSGGNIKLEHSYYVYDEGSTISITREGSVIDGNGAIIDMAGSSIRAFTATAENVTFKNLTIKNVDYNGDGGAIYFNGNGNVVNCNFTNNKAVSYSGGAVYFAGDGNVANSKFDNNSAGYGGAVYFSDKGQLTDCSFVGNSAENQGGAILFGGDGNITGCNFANNVANSSYYGGGAIFFGFAGNVANCNFTNNEATFGNAGAICFIRNGEATNCSFTGNSAKETGGAVLFGGDGNITGCSFANNEVDSGNGGAVYFSKSNSHNAVNNCSFINNKASSGNGGAICFNENSAGTVKHSNFVNNSAKISGAILFDFGSTGTVENCNFTGNEATSGDGGAIYFVMSGSPTVVANCNFSNNKANSGSYGAIVIYEGNVINCSFVDNSAKLSGGAICFTKSGSAENCSFTNNEVTSGNGGAVYFARGGNVTNCNFTNNKVSTGNGGAIMFYDGNGNVSDCNFVNNFASNYGGAVYFVDAGNVENCNFTGNNASSGSAIFFNNPLETISKTVSNSIFLNNRANAKSIQIVQNGTKIEIIFKGNDYLINAIYSRTDSSEVIFTNVTYWGANGITNTGNSPTNLSQSNREAGQNIAVVVVVNDILVLNATKVTDENGTIVLDALAGNCTVAAYHYEDSYYTQANATETFNSTGNETAMVLSYSEFSVTATVSPDVAIGNVTFVVENKSGIVKTVEVTLSGGIAKFDLNELSPGIYDVTATYGGNIHYFPSIKNISVDMRSDVPINVGDISISYGDAAKVVVSVPDTLNGQNITVTVNKISMNVTVSKGEAEATFTGLSAGEYEIVVDYLGDDHNFANATTAKLTVNKLKTQLSANAVTATYNVNKYLTITLKDGKGKALGGVKVTVNLNGAKTYTTDKNGQIKIATKGLAPKAYTSKIAFNGNANYVKSTKNVKVTVKKATPKLTAKSKKFKRSVKVKKYTVILKSNVGKAIKNAKVTLKIKGKKAITVKTNSKGKATFKIKKLTKKGKYRASVTYKGNKYYNKVTKKVKITIR